MKRLKENILEELEFRILSETWMKGERIPPERNLAEEFSVSRPVIHEALLILESRGLITLRPRHGAVVNDIRAAGTIDLLTSLLCHPEEDGMSREVLRSLYRVRALMESDAAVLACRTGSDDDWAELEGIIEPVTENPSPEVLAERDFLIHHTVAKISGNIVYPLLINSLKPVYQAFLTTFYRKRGDTGEIRTMQRELLGALRLGKETDAMEIMKKLSSFTLE